MAADFQSARFWAAELMEGALCPGAVAVDATLGNGHDALWLANLVGETGHVYGFDVQAEAVENTRLRLKAAGLENRATLILDGHENMGKYLPPAGVDGVMFNLGWLPGAAHGVTTKVETTLRAAEAALAVLKEGAIVTICVYPGHAEGAREREALLSWAAGLDGRAFDTMLRCYLNQGGEAPLMIAVRKNKRSKKHEAG